MLATPNIGETGLLPSRRVIDTRGVQVTDRLIGDDLVAGNGS
jgi:hypothetical protein